MRYQRVTKTRPDHFELLKANEEQLHNQAVYRETLLTESGPRSRNEIAKRIMKTATAIRSPIVKDCVIMKTLRDCHRGPQSRSEILFNNEDCINERVLYFSHDVVKSVVNRTLK